ncbi:response regulator [Acidobacteriota bacterium]
MSKKVRLLVIEDEKDEMKNICYVLKEAGYETISALDGKTGLEKAKTEKPDLIICDLNMPGLTGYEVLEEVRKAPETKHIPFIILSAFPRPDDIDMEFRVGVQEYITKPFYFKELLGRIKMCLDERESV